MTATPEVACVTSAFWRTIPQNVVGAGTEAAQHRVVADFPYERLASAIPKAVVVHNMDPVCTAHRDFVQFGDVIQACTVQCQPPEGLQ